MVNQPPSRRDVLRMTGAAIASGTLLTGAASGDEGQKATQSVVGDPRKKGEEPFDPDDDKEVRQFIQGIEDLPEDEQLEVVGSLSTEHREAVSAGLQIDSVTHTVNGKDVAGKSAEGIPAKVARAQANGPYDFKLSETAKSKVGVEIWTWNHEISWAVDPDYGSACGDEIVDYDHSAWFSDMSVGWRSTGTNGDDSLVANRDDCGPEVRSRKVGELEHCFVGTFGVVCPGNVTVTSVLTGDDRGYGSVEEYDHDDSEL